MTFAAGDGDLADLAGKAEPRVTFRTLKIFELSKILQANEELSEASMRKGDVLLILGIAFLVIAGKHANHGIDIEGQAQYRQQGKTRKTSKYRQRQSSD